MTQKSPTQLCFDDIIHEIHQTLKPLGFKKKSLNFYRVQNGFHHFINIQKSTHSSADSMTFTINVGVDFSNDDQQKFTSIHHFALKERIGRIVNNSDIWYDLDGEILNITQRTQQMNATKNEVLAHLSCVLSFFANMDSEDKIKCYFQNKYLNK